jgi:hypothetical protein
MLEILPQDEVILKAYRQLLVESARRHSEEVAGQEMPPMNKLSVTEELPEAPQTLIAPTPVQGPKVTPVASELEALVKSYATALGYYFLRKSKGAAIDELRHLLEQLKYVYGSNGIDLSLVNKELSELGITKPAPQGPKVQPKKTAPKPTPKKKAAPPSPHKISANSAELKKATELNQSWQYYNQAVEKGINDHEKMEILESILMRFGEDGAQKVKGELNRIKKRMK